MSESSGSKVSYTGDGKAGRSIPSGVKSNDGSGERSGKVVNGIGMGSKDGGSSDLCKGKGSYTHKKEGY